MRRILVIDDDQDIRETSKVLLEHEGFEVIVAEDGPKGLALFGAMNFDAVVIDLFMPGMDGLSTIKAFRQCSPSVPIIAMSGFMDLYAFRDSTDRGPDFLSMASEVGAVASVSKPFRPRDLLRAVQDSLATAA